MTITIDRPIEIDTELVDTLRRTRGWLLQHGWAHHYYGQTDGPGCLEYAMHAVNGDVDELALLLQFVGIGDRTPAEWNDQPGRTFADVIALIDRAIEVA